METTETERRRYHRRQRGARNVRKKTSQVASSMSPAHGSLTQYQGWHQFIKGLKCLQVLEKEALEHALMHTVQEGRAHSEILAKPKFRGLVSTDFDGEELDISEILPRYGCSEMRRFDIPEIPMDRKIAEMRQEPSHVESTSEIPQSSEDSDAQQHHKDELHMAYAQFLSEVTDFTSNSPPSVLQGKDEIWEGCLSRRKHKKEPLLSESQEGATETQGLARNPARASPQSIKHRKHSGNI